MESKRVFFVAHITLIAETVQIRRKFHDSSLGRNTEFSDGNGMKSAENLSQISSHSNLLGTFFSRTAISWQKP